MCALRFPKPRLDFLSPAARGPRRRSRMIEKSTRLTEEITKTVDIMGIASSSPQIRMRRGLSIALMTQRSGARSIVPQDTIRKSEKLFLDHKKVPPLAAPVTEEAHRGEHHQANHLDDDEQMGEINVIFRGSMSIASKT
jgi:hypothetical protein